MIHHRLGFGYHFIRHKIRITGKFGISVFTAEFKTQIHTVKCSAIRRDFCWITTVFNDTFHIRRIFPVIKIGILIVFWLSLGNHLSRVIEIDFIIHIHSLFYRIITHCKESVVESFFFHSVISAISIGSHCICLYHIIVYWLWVGYSLRDTVVPVDSIPILFAIGAAYKKVYIWSDSILKIFPPCFGYDSAVCAFKTGVCSAKAVYDVWYVFRDIFIRQGCSFFYCSHPKHFKYYFGIFCYGFFWYCFSWLGSAVDDSSVEIFVSTLICHKHFHSASACGLSHDSYVLRITAECRDVLVYPF